MYQGEVQALHRVMVRLHREGGFPCGILDMQSHRCPNEGQQQAKSRLLIFLAAVGCTKRFLMLIRSCPLQVICRSSEHGRQERQPAAGMPH